MPRAEPLAYVVYDGDVRCGFLGGAAGPFLSRVRSPFDPPQLAAARFTSTDPGHELSISEILLETQDFARAVAALQAAGFRLEPEPYRELFPGDAR